MHPGLQTQVSIHDELAGFGFGFRFAFWPWLFGRDVCRLWGGYDRDIQSVHIYLGKGMSAGRQNVHTPRVWYLLRRLVIQEMKPCLFAGGQYRGGHGVTGTFRNTEFDSICEGSKYTEDTCTLFREEPLNSYASQYSPEICEPWALAMWGLS